MISSVVCFTDTSGSLDAITVVFVRNRVLLGGGGGTGVSGSLFVICGIRLRVGGGGGTGVSSRTHSLNRVLALLTETGSGTGVSCASFSTPLLKRRLGCLGLGTGVSSRTSWLNHGIAL